MNITRNFLAVFVQIAKRALGSSPWLYQAARRVYASYIGNRSYSRWIRTMEVRPIVGTARAAEAGGIKISVIVPVYNVPARYLHRCIRSVLRQSHGNWELCICDDGSTNLETITALKSYEGTDERIKIAWRPKNGHICAASNDALALATGEYVALLDNDDELAPWALAEVAKALAESVDIDVLYSDVDQIEERGNTRFCPNFKPDWSPDTLMSAMYMIHLLVIRRSLVMQVGAFRSGYEGSQDYDLALRVTEVARRIVHLPQVLYHWRLISTSTAARGMSAKPYAAEAAVRAKRDALARRGLDGEVVYDPRLEQSHVEYRVSGEPLVSIIIPTRDHKDDLERCISSIADKTTWKNKEIIVVDNGSDDPGTLGYLRGLSEARLADVVRVDEPFNFSRLINKGVSSSRGEYMLLLNNDTEVIDPRWIERMLGLAQLSHVGAVGARLLYPDGTVQHAGVVNFEMGPGHPYAGFKPSDLRYYRFALDGNWLAVTGACLLVARTKFDEVGGFDEELAVAYNDVAFCFSLRDKGYFNAVAQRAELYHHESRSRGQDSSDAAKKRRQMAEMRILYSKFPHYRGIDPFYNANLAPDRGDFSVRQVPSLEPMCYREEI